MNRRAAEKQSVRTDARLVIEAVLDAIDIDALIEAITEENRHPETDWGAPVGAEFW